MKLLHILVLLVLILSGGCATQQTRIDLSTKKKPLEFTNVIASPTKADEQYLKKHFELVRKDAEITLNRHFFAYIPLNGFYAFSDVTVVDRLLNNYDGDLVTDLDIEKNLDLLLLYNRYYVYAKGDIWRRIR